MATQKTTPRKNTRKSATGSSAALPRKASGKTVSKAPRKAPGKTARKTVAGKGVTAKAPAKAGARKAAAPAGAKRAGAKRAGAKRVSGKPLKIAVRNSPIHGRGVYATAAIKKGERVMEYIGEIISWKEADERPPSDPNDPHHTFLFSLSDGKKVIDASQKGNDARWINHSCAPNCETEETGSGRVFVEALRDIAAGEELNYDYCLIIDEKLTSKLKQQYACRCGADSCRGTMLALPKKKKKKKKKH